MTAAPALPAGLLRAYGPDALTRPPLMQLSALVFGCWLLGGFALRTVPRTAALLLMLGWAAALYAVAPALVYEPTIGLLLSLGALGTALALRVAATSPPGAYDSESDVGPQAARASVLTSVGLWFSLWADDPAVDRTLLPFLGTSFAISFAFILARIVQLAYRRRAGDAALPGVNAAGDEGPWWTPFIDHPARLLVSTFASLSVAGTLLLLSPWVTSGPDNLALSEAMFTAISAVCVNGLSVIDVSRTLSGAGQAVVLVLIQLGGLGIMTFSTVAFGLLGRRLSLRHEAAVAGLLSPDDRGRLFGATRRVMLVTFAIEGVGATILTACFIAEGQGVGQALWAGVFTAISAFCNAGFTLTSDGLVSLQTRPLVLHTVATLIIAGGLSPVLIASLPRLFRRGGRQLRAEQRLVLVATAVLLVGGTVLFAVLEWHHSLAGLDTIDKLHNAWFQSTMMRSAGFLSVDFGALHPATITVMLVIMFIGGSPGGTAGGIKTTTAALLLLAVVTAIRGRRTMAIFGRSIPDHTVYKAAAITTVGTLAVLSAVVLLQLTQRIPTTYVVAEAVSALATVGLTLGATPMLDVVGRTIIGACMFIGRIGPLTLFMLLGERRSDDVWQYPVEEIQVG